MHIVYEKLQTPLAIHLRIFTPTMKHWAVPESASAIIPHCFQPPHRGTSHVFGVRPLASTA
jgi:hypothetical protein